MIVAERLTKYYGDRAAVADVSFTIAGGEVVGLLGLNGAGKTTTLRILSGLLLPTAGRVSIAGADMAREPEAARARIGFLPEQPPLYPEMTVRAYLEFVAHIKGFSGDVDQAIADALAAADLTSVAGDRISTLSHGFQRRVGIAQAIVHKPTLILLDEPTAGLDPVQIVQMRQLVRGLRGRNTILVSSHLLSEIHQVCDRILVMQNGRIVAEGSEQELAGRLGSKTTVSVEVRGAAAALAAALSRAAVARHHIDREENGLTYATVELKSDNREELARALVEAGLGLRRLERVELELESIFLKLTSSESRQRAP
ncbi:MAG: ABC transporter ATP-binding protein [Deltaproteobacteria bacterium]|nr:ABC transporter ATP-binding protein [Deltaproteobacteria bacterium]